MSKKKSFIVKPHIETFQAVPRAQSIVWTVTPKGRRSNGNLQLSLIASPRLQVKQMQTVGVSAPPEVQLSYFPHFIDWPTWLEQTLFKNLSITFQSDLKDAKKTFTALYQPKGKGVKPVALKGKKKVKQITLVPDIPVDPSLWPRVFPPSTTVRSFGVELKNIQISETAIDNLELENHIDDIYSRCGVEFINPPPVDQMLNINNFGSIMGEKTQLKVTPAAVAKMSPDVVSNLATQEMFNPGQGKTRTMSYNLPAESVLKSGLPSMYKINVESAYKPLFKQLQLGEIMAVPAFNIKPYDFHEIISILLNYPALMRKLGLVIDLEIQDTAKVSGIFNVGINPEGLQGESWEYHAAPLTHCVADNKSFYAASQPGSGIAPGGMLAFEDDVQYRPMQTDVIGGGFKNMQFKIALKSFKINRSGIAAGISDTAANGSDAAASGSDSTALPAERTVGIGMRMIDRVKKLKERFEYINKLDDDCFYSKNGMVSGIKDRLTLYAEDLLRGSRVDTAVYDDAAKDWKWYSLCRRDVQYFIGDETINFKPSNGESPDAEGVVTTGLVKQDYEDEASGKVTSQHQLLESMFRWNGWSLCVSPPSGKVFPEDECGPGAGIPDNAGSQLGLNVKTRISVACGSLPLLRFGKKYKFRARTADIAGNSLPWNSKDESHASPEIVFRRFEPVPTPIVRQDTVPGPDSPGESLETLVIRSNYDTDKEDQPTKRYFSPPQTTLPMAEYHGMLDKNGSFDPDRAKEVVKEYIEPLRSFKMTSSKFNAGKHTTEKHTSDERYKSGKYLKDPLALGVVFNGLPGSGDEVFEGGFSKTGKKWPENMNKISIKIVEGSKPPERTGDEITVYLPKAEQVRVNYSSLLNDTGLNKMAQWGRMNKYKLAVDTSQVNKLMKTVKSDALKGLHYMFTPHRQLLLVHAVKQPMEEPVLVPVFDPDNRKKDTMRKDINSTWSYMDGVIQIHGKSTGSVDVYAYFSEFIDDTVSDEPATIPVKQHVLRSDVHLNGSSAISSSGGVVNYMEKPERGALFLGTHINDVVVQPMKKNAKKIKEFNGSAFKLADKYKLSEMWGAAAIKQVAKKNNFEIAAVAGTLKVIPPKHEFTDTKHRAIVYEVEGTTRFREYFNPMRRGGVARQIIANNMQHNSSSAAQSGKTASGEKDNQVTGSVLNNLSIDSTTEASFRRKGPKTMTIHIPSSARPAPVRIAYAVPTFGWTELKEEGKTLTRTRKGNGIRVFVERPWFSSGENELLGAVVLGNKMGMDEKWEPYVSQWGGDPIWKTAPLPSDVPRAMHFQGGLDIAHGLSLAEKESQTQGKNGLSVIGYGTTYDKNRRLWYADIEMSPGNSYFPFVRLALARYQPYSVENTHLSAITLTDFIQLLPDRTASVESVKRDGEKFLKITVNGIRGNASHVMFEAGLEKASKYISDDLLKWQPVGRVPSVQAEEGSSVTLSVPVSHDLEPGEYRLVIKEYEIFERMTVDEKNALQREKGNLTEEDVTGRRIVYSDVFDVNGLLN